MSVEPGWYKDPAEPNTQRYWDGDGWQGDPLPADATPPPGPPAPAKPPAGDSAAGARPAAGISARPVVTPAPAGSAPPGAPSPGAPSPGTAPPGMAPPGATVGQPAMPIKLPPGAPHPGMPHPTAVPSGAARPTAPSGAQPAPPGVLPPGAIPWRPGMPLPPGYRVVFTPAVPPRPHGLPLAPLGLRLLARLIDIAIVLGLSALATGWLVYLYVSDVTPFVDAVMHQFGQTNPNYDDLPAVPGRANLLSLLIPIISMIIWAVYEVPAIAARGQTLGKRIVGIRVMALEGDQPLGVRRALRRWNLLGLPMLFWSCGIGFILQFVDALSPVMGGPLQLALHDRSAQTVVVQAGRLDEESTPSNTSPPGETR